MDPGKKDTRSSSETDADPDDEKVQSLGKASGTFDHRGGKLTIDDCDVTVTIPPGALEEGGSQEIFVEVLMKKPDELVLQDDEMMVNFGVRCTPSGLTFKKPVIVSMPHCAIFTDPRSADSVVFTRGDEEDDSTWTRDDTVKCTYSKDRVEMRLSHFSSFASAVKTLFVNFKRVCFVPSLPDKLSSDRITTLYVHLFDLLNGNFQLIKRERENLQLKPVFTTEILDLSATVDDDLTITITLHSEPTKQVSTKIVPYNSLCGLVWRNETFRLDLTQSPDDTLLSLFLKQEMTRDVIMRTGYTDKDVLTSRTAGSNTPIIDATHRHTIASKEIVTEDELDELSERLPQRRFHRFCRYLVQTNYNEAEAILASCNDDFVRATRKVLADWKTRTGGRSRDLLNALDRAGTVGIQRA